MNNNELDYESNFPSIIIDKIILNDNTEIELYQDDIVIFVGANNVGKTRMLKDIKSDLLEPMSKKVLIKEIIYKEINFGVENINKYLSKNYSLNNNGNYEIYVDNNNLCCIDKYMLEQFENRKREIYKIFLTYLFTENRLNITSPIHLNNCTDHNIFNILNKLSKDKSKINQLNDLLEIEFQKGIEVCEESSYCDVVKKYKIGNIDEIRNIIDCDSRSANEKLNQLEDLSEQWDGVRSAVAILASLIVNNYSLTLIDEPETFLHPPQARLLGKNIVELSSGKQLFISTHNIDLIRGILSTNSKRVKIIKIERNNNVNKFYSIDNESIHQLSNDRNLKYTNILNGLFYEQVVLCENESDCKFYSTILQSVDSKIYQNTLFCAVGGKDQFKIIIPLLNKIKVKYKIIGDLDLINDSSKLECLINSIQSNGYSKIKEIHQKFLNEYIEGTNFQVKSQKNIKKEINELFTDDNLMPPSVAKKIKEILKTISNFDLLKKSGVSSFPKGPCNDYYVEIKRFLNDNNVFILDCGEIECFIPNIDAHGSEWVDIVFAKYKLDDKKFDASKQFISEIFGIS